MLQRNSVWLMAVLMVLTFLGGSAARGMLIVDGRLEDFRRPIPLPQPQPQPIRFAPIRTLEHRIDVTVRDQVATTTVEQVFHNPASRVVEGTFLFPLPAGANIDRFTMEVNGEKVEAELLDADKARQIYQNIVRQMRDPALLEYAGTQLLTCRIFPFQPNEKKRITLRYTQVLRNDNGLITYTYPLNTEKHRAEPTQNVSIRVAIESRQAIKSVYSPTHDIDVKRKGDHEVVAGFEANRLRSDVDFQLIYGVEHTDAPIGVNLMTFNDPAEDEEGGFFLLLASPGAFTRGEVIDKDVIFVVDTSGSMAGEKIRQVQGALHYCIHSLNEGDRFQVLRFSTDVESLFDGLVDATKANREKAISFVDRFRAAGGTAIDSALAEAVKVAGDRRGADRPCTVIFLTDGQPTVGARDENTIVRNVTDRLGRKNVRIFSFGVGFDVNTHLLDKLSEKTNAITQYVLPKEDIEIKVSSFYARISEPVLAQVELRVEGDVRLHQMHPSPLPDLFTGQQLVVLGRYRGQGDAMLVLQGQVNGKPMRFEHKATFPRRDTEHRFIPQLWATRRVGFLLDEIRLSKDNKELREEVTRLARRYGIVTPYTSYLIVEDEEQRGVPMARRAAPAAAAPVEQAALSESFNRMKMARGGEAGVAGATSNQVLRNAGKLSDFQQAQAFAQLDHQNAGLPQQTVRHVQGRAFYKNASQWVDARVAERPNSRVVRVVFDSPEYYELLERQPQVANWLSVGRNVQILLDDTIYEIVEEEG